MTGQPPELDILWMENKGRLGNNTSLMATPKKAYLVVPPTGLYIREDRCQTPIEHLKTVALRPPIDLMYAAAAFERGGADCLLTDFPAEGLGWRDLEDRLRQIQPDYLVLSITTPSLEDDLQAARLAKQVSPRTTVIAKGAHFNVLDVETLERHQDLDAVLRGEYEPACEAIARGLAPTDIAGVTSRNASGAIHRSPAPEFVDDLDGLPFPARHLVRNELYVRPDTAQPQTTVVTNRGCPHQCIFCLAPQVGGRKNRYRSVGNVLEELAECLHKFGIHNFLFRSDTFTQQRDWVIELCREIIGRRLSIEWVCNSRVDTIDTEMLDWMKRAGCWLIAFGVESGDERSLDLMNKRADAAQARDAIAMTRRAGIRSSVYMLMGLPWESEETIRNNVAYFCQLDADFVEIFYVYPFPGTALYDMAVREGLLAKGEIPREAYGEPAMPTVHLSKAELAKWRRRAMRRLLLRPRYIARTLARCRSPRELFNYLRHGWIQMVDLMH